MKLSSFPIPVRYFFGISLVFATGILAYGFFQQKSAPLVIHDHVLPEVPFKEELPIKQAAFTTEVHPTAKIQVAVLLDVSNSMDGLINQAKAQLWDMVSTMGQVRCEGMAPTFELSLYEYGRPSNGESNGFIKQLHPFTSNLDQVSSSLFSLSTHGGDEYCPQVIVKSAEDLSWDSANTTYKVIFIAGNETFRQGPVAWVTACQKAREKGIIVNTIYCGPRQTGIAEYWNLGAECGHGNFTNINQDATIEDIPTPYDSILFVLNEKLNSTYISFGAEGSSASLMQASVDRQNYEMNKAAAAKRVEVKGKKELYKNDDWDLVDAVENKKVSLATIDREALPDSLKRKSASELEQVVAGKSKQRSEIQNQIAEAAKKRNDYLAEERKKRTSGDATLQSEMEKIIREQVKRYNMKVE
jgi:hypothetical protein